MKNTVILINLLLLTSCGYMRICDSSLRQFSLSDKNKLKNAGRRILEDDLDSIATKFKFDFYNTFSGYQSVSPGVISLSDLKIWRYRPRVKSKQYKYDLSYFIQYQKIDIICVRIPLDSNISLDSSRVAFETYQKNVDDLFNIYLKGGLKKVDQVLCQAESYDFKRAQCHGLTERNNKQYLYFVRYFKNEFFKGEVLLVNIFNPDDIILMSTDDFYSPKNQS